METKKTKYYTWKGLEKLHSTYGEAQKEVNEKELKNVFPAGFEYKEEAEAFRKGELDEYIQKNYKQFDAAQYDAVVYTDGSYDTATKIASYGLIIFFRDEADPVIESGTLEDVEERKYRIVRYDKNGKQKGQPEYCHFKSKPQKSGYISVAGSVAGEFLGTKRSLEICCKKRDLKKF